MNNHKINFDDIEWTNASTGLRYKAFIHGNQRLRLMEFSGGFIEQNWCIGGHAGIVLDGSYAVHFSDHIERYSKGDVIFIPSGEASKHKAVLALNEKVTLLLFELINN